MNAIHTRSFERHAIPIYGSWPVIAVTGLAFEARIAAGSGVRVVHGNGRGELLASLREAVASGSRGIVSFGVAGGLDPDVAAGQCVIAGTVVAGGRCFPTSHRWSQLLLRAFPAACRGAIIGVDRPVASPAAKRRLHRETGAIAVDTESDLAARVAAAHGLPFVAIRIIIDPAHRFLPPAALVSTHGNGKIDLAGILTSLVRRPGQFPELMRLACDARAARSALVRGRRLLESHLGIPDFDGQLIDVSQNDIQLSPIRVERHVPSPSVAPTAELVRFP